MDAAKAAFDSAETKEARAKKELKRKRSAAAASSEDVTSAEQRASAATSERERTYADLFDRAREHEAVKMIRVKDALTKFSSAHLDLAEKAGVLFKASLAIAEQIPDVHGREGGGVSEMNYSHFSSSMLVE